MTGTQVAEIRRNADGNVELTIGSVAAVLTPDQVDVFVRQLLRKAHPREAMFIIPVPPDEAA